jgi:transcriptional regulator of arginine metabolism
MSIIKDARHEVILGIVRDQNVSSQAQLKRELEEHGHKVNQATLSRDLKELKIAKIIDPTGAGYRYQHRLRSSSGVDQAVSSISGNMIVWRTRTGLAPALAYEIDRIHLPTVLGTIAGEDTVLTVVAEDANTEEVEQLIWNSLET